MAIACLRARLIDVSQSLQKLSKRRGQWLALLVAPALILRAVIPAGFMPFAGPDGAYLGFCPGSGALPPGESELATHTSHGGHTHHGAGAPGAPGTHHHPSCLFSTGAITTFATLLAAVFVQPVTSAPSVWVGSLVFVPAILRSQSSRAPPALA